MDLQLSSVHFLVSIIVILRAYILCLFFGSYMDLTLKFCTYFCLHYQCFYVCFWGHIWILHLSFVPIFVYIINVFMFVFWVIYGPYS
jgi:hypothetical protein